MRISKRRVDESYLRARNLPQPRTEQDIAWDEHWRTWLFLTGRGFGKSWALSWHAVHCVINLGYKEVAVVGASLHDTRSVMIESESGVLEMLKKFGYVAGEDYVYAPSKREIRFLAEQAKIRFFSADRAAQARGKNIQVLFVDEWAFFPRLGEGGQSDPWVAMQAAVRKDPAKIVIATTPQPLEIIEKTIERETTRLIQGTIFDNPYLSPTAVEAMKDEYGDTRDADQELYGKFTLEVVNAMFTRKMLSGAQRDYTPDEKTLERVVVAVDPAGSHRSKDSSLTGIVVCAKDKEGYGWVLEDLTLRARPDGWANVAVSAYHRWKANLILCERNYGGDLVRNTIEKADDDVKIKEVNAKKGKATRAEPISRKFEKGDVKLAPGLSELRRQLEGFEVSTQLSRGRSPDRMDSAIYGLTNLLVGKKAISWTDGGGSGPSAWAIR